LPLTRITVSRWLYDIAQSNDLDSILVENGVDRTLFSPPAGDHKRDLSVLAMVSEHDWKRSDLVVGLMQSLSVRHPAVRLGTFGTCARPTGLPRSVKHLRRPAVSALIELYRSSQIFVCTSDFEGFGLPALEAMSCGCALVTTDNGGVPAFAGDAAIVSPRGDAPRLLSAVEQLLQDRSEVNNLSTKAVMRASELSLTRAAEKFESAIVDATE
jgi:glycosyltransferase involved in cell wall biosynthesis